MESLSVVWGVSVGECEWFKVTWYLNMRRGGEELVDWIGGWVVMYYKGLMWSLIRNLSLTSCTWIVLHGKILNSNIHHLYRKPLWALYQFFYFCMNNIWTWNVIHLEFSRLQETPGDLEGLTSKGRGGHYCPYNHCCLTIFTNALML